MPILGTLLQNSPYTDPLTGDGCLRIRWWSQFFGQVVGELFGRAPLVRMGVVSLRQWVAPRGSSFAGVREPHTRRTKSKPGLAVFLHLAQGTTAAKEIWHQGGPNVS